LEDRLSWRLPEKEEPKQEGRKNRGGKVPEAIIVVGVEKGEEVKLRQKFSGASENQAP